MDDHDQYEAHYSFQIQCCTCPYIDAVVSFLFFFFSIDAISILMRKIISISFINENHVVEVISWILIYFIYNTLCLLNEIIFHILKFFLGFNAT